VTFTPSATRVNVSFTPSLGTSGIRLLPSIYGALATSHKSKSRVNAEADFDRLFICIVGVECGVNMNMSIFTRIPITSTRYGTQRAVHSGCGSCRPLLGPAVPAHGQQPPRLSCPPQCTAPPLPHINRFVGKGPVGLPSRRTFQLMGALGPLLPPPPTRRACTCNACRCSC
jgi:hypothetical protein